MKLLPPSRHWCQQPRRPRNRNQQWSTLNLSACSDLDITGCSICKPSFDLDGVSCPSRWIINLVVRVQLLVKAGEGHFELFLLLMFSWFCVVVIVYFSESALAQIRQCPFCLSVYGTQSVAHVKESRSTFDTRRFNGQWHGQTHIPINSSGLFAADQCGDCGTPDGKKDRRFSDAKRSYSTETLV